MGKVLFHRDFQGFTGGHLKVWDYFNHTFASDNYLPYVNFSPNSLWNCANPWQSFSEQIVQDLAGFQSDVLFLAGLDWLQIPIAERYAPRLPVINLIQGFRHADPLHKCYEFLQYPAIRICVSQEIQTAIDRTGKLRGKTLVIPNGIDLAKFGEYRNYWERDRRPADVTIVATKQPQLGGELAEELQKIHPHLQIKLLSQRLPRHEFIHCLGSSRVTVFLPLAQEGFYLPALEGMAAGTLVVCPDCVGNRSFCLDTWNCWRPEYKLKSILQMIDYVLRTPESEKQQIHDNAQLTVAKHDLIAERQAFLKILTNVEQLWQEVLT